MTQAAITTEVDCQVWWRLGKSTLASSPRTSPTNPKMPRMPRRRATGSPPDWLFGLPASGAVTLRRPAGTCCWRFLRAIAGRLARLLVRRVPAAPAAVLVELDPVGRVALGFVGLVVPRLALLTRQRDQNPNTCCHGEPSGRLSQKTVSQGLGAPPRREDREAAGQRRISRCQRERRPRGTAPRTIRARRARARARPPTEPPQPVAPGARPAGHAKVEIDQLLDHSTAESEQVLTRL